MCFKCFTAIRRAEGEEPLIDRKSAIEYNGLYLYITYSAVGER